MIYPRKDRNLTIRRRCDFIVKAIVYLLESSLNIDFTCSPLSLQSTRKPMLL